MEIDSLNSVPHIPPPDNIGCVGLFCTVFHSSCSASSAQPVYYGSFLHYCLFAAGCCGFPVKRIGYSFSFHRFQYSMVRCLIVWFVYQKVAISIFSPVGAIQ